MMWSNEYGLASPSPQLSLEVVLGAGCGLLTASHPFTPSAAWLWRGRALRTLGGSHEGA